MFKQALTGEQHRQLDLWSDGHSLFLMDHYCHQM